MSGNLQTFRAAVAFVENSGIALVFPSDDIVLPSLWEAVIGDEQVTVFVVDDHGKRVLSPELEQVWSLHDRLAVERGAVVGKHVRNRLALISPGLLAARYALTGRRGRPDDFRDAEPLSPLERELAEGLLITGPRTAPELRRLLGLHDARRVKRALESLQRQLVITRAGEAEQRQGWSAAIFDLVARRYEERLRHLPDPDEARATLAAAVLRPAEGALRAADLAAVLGCTRAEATAALNRDSRI